MEIKKIATISSTLRMGGKKEDLALEANVNYNVSGVTGNIEQGVVIKNGSQVANFNAWGASSNINFNGELTTADKVAIIEAVDEFISSAKQVNED